jgi:NAD(P)-dependent dehydrogenase (short-subunit alcohol dehydrogenase family)
MRGLSNKVIVISGGSGGIGLAMAQRLVEEGARVVSLDRRPTGSSDIETMICDVTREAEVEECFRRIGDMHGRVDGIVSNAAIYQRDLEAPIHDLSMETWRDTLAVNLTGAYLFCKYGVRAIRKNGSGAVVVVGSPNGQYGCNPGSVAYSASKAGLYGMARVMAIDYARDGIRVNLLLPGYVPTGLNSSMSSDPEIHKATVSTLPMGRAGRPEEIAASAAFLLSDDAAFITGAGLYADGGLTAW